MGILSWVIDEPPAITNDADTDRWIIVIIAFVVAFILVALTRRLVRTLGGPLRLQDYAASLVTRVINATILLLTFVFVLGQFDIELAPLIGALGISSIIIAMALQPVMGNLVGAVLLHARRPIKPGDQIDSNDHRGTVIDITSRAVVIMTFDGERVYLPNLAVLEKPLLNQTIEPYRRTVLPFQVSYDTPLRDTVRAVAKAIRSIEALADAPPGDVFVTSFDDSGISLVAQFWHPSEELSARFAVSEVAIAIKETLDANGVEIPFPQRVVHLRNGDDRPLLAVSDETTVSPVDGGPTVGGREG